MSAVVVIVWASEMWMGITVVLQVLQLQHCHQNASLHVLDQIIKLTSVLLLLSLYLPLCHLYDCCCLMAVDWTLKRMKILVLHVVQ